VKRAVVVRPQARSELDDQAEYIACDSLDAAIRFLRAAEATFDQLAGSPELGRRWESTHERLRGIRVWRVKGFPSHLIFYRPIAQGVEVLHVLHGARDLPVILEGVGDDL
jgi:toxin ParE1/3/4